MTLTADYLLIGGLAAALGLAAVVCAATVATARRLGRRLAAIEDEFERLRGEVRTATGIGVRAGERLRRLDQISVQLGERLGQLELRGEGRPYDQAIALVRRGADADRLMSHYGLSRGEADLVTLLHGRKAG